jgi:hypothetical protein
MSVLREILSLDAQHVCVLRDLVADLDDQGRFAESAAVYEALLALQARIQMRAGLSCPVDTACGDRPQPLRGREPHAGAEASDLPPPQVTRGETKKIDRRGEA